MVDANGMRPIDYVRKLGYDMRMSGQIIVREKAEEYAGWHYPVWVLQRMIYMQGWDYANAMLNGNTNNTNGNNVTRESTRYTS